MGDRITALEALIDKATKKGYIILDDVMDIADQFALSIQDVDWLSDSVATKGIIIYDEEPATQSITDDDIDDRAQIDYEAIYERVIELDPSLTGYIDTIRAIKPPQFREMAQLQYLVREGNQHARSRIFEMHLRLAVKVALQRAEVYDYDISDAIQDACMGLITAVDKYDPDSNGAFASYATLYILQSLSRMQPVKASLMHYPAHQKEAYLNIYPVVKDRGCMECAEFCSCNMLVDDLALEMGIPHSKIEELLSMVYPSKSVEGEYEVFLQEHDVAEANGRDPARSNHYNAFCDIWGEEDMIDCVAESILRDMIRNVLDTLTPREENVLRMRYGFWDGKEQSLLAIGNKLKVTRERVRQIEAKALRKLRHPSRCKRLKGYI